MQVKTVSYKRILNLGNYESKHLEMLIEIQDVNNIEDETSQLMELVEQKIRENSAREIELEIEKLKAEIRELMQTKILLKKEIKDEEQAKSDDLVPVEHYLNENEDDEDDEEDF